MLKLYNSLTREKEEFKPLEEGKVRIYNCGPTVYDFAHIGNLRRFIAADLLKRTLEYFGYEVYQVTNITDVGHLTDENSEDKVVKRAQEEKKDPYEIAKFYEDAFFRDLKKLNVEIDKDRSKHYPKATDNIAGMIKMIEGLLNKGLAYITNKGVYFDITKAKDYGKLSGNKLENLEAGKRVEVDSSKKHPADFALWIIASKEHLMQWDSPWGRGYPGWHIECSAMALSYLGEEVDIHTGGVDNKFPHHENEIAQSEGLLGKQHINFWIHNAHLLVEGEKMSKSLNNFYTLSDIEKKGFTPLIFRLLVLSTHYRNTIDFSWDDIKQAQENLDGLRRLVSRLKGVNGEEMDLSIYENKFREALEDDLNLPLALSSIYELQKDVNKKLDAEGVESASIINFIKKIDQVLGLNLIQEEVDIEILKLLEEREKMRKDERFGDADKIRMEIEDKGYLIEDTKEGARVLKK